MIARALEEAEDKHQTQRHGRNTILVVDDMELNRAILCEAFREDYDLLEAENGQQAWEIICRDPDAIAAVLLDALMPVMDGFQLLEELYQRQLLSRVPVFIITADCSEEKMRQGYDMGVMDIISKPVVPYFLRRRVSSVVELYQARERLSSLVNRQEEKLEIQAREIQELNLSIIEALSTAIEFRDCESGEHVQRIHDLTVQLLEGLREGGFEGCAFTDEQIEQIATAAIMHDVGKISIPDSILNKPGRLTPEEFEVMKTHTIKGCELLEKIPKSKDNPIYQYAYDICRHHHERWDGKGYPDGLRGEEISIWAQVVSLADVYDALTNERCYKLPFTQQEAFGMIMGGQCGAFNPNLLKAFQTVIGEKAGA